MKTKLTYTYPAFLQSCFLIASCILFINLQTSGQSKNEEVTIIAPYIPSIGDATKIPFRPDITQDKQDPPAFEYEYITKRFETSMELNSVNAMKYSKDKKDEAYRNYAKVGLGNYQTPYLDFMASSLQSEKYLFGARIRHLSSQGKIKDYPPSAYSHNQISVFGKTFSKTHTLSANIGYKRDVVHFYGFMPDSFPEATYTKDDIKQRFQHFYGEAEYGSNYQDKDKLNHTFGLGLHYYSDYFDTRELQLSFLTKLNKEFGTIGRDYEHALSLELGLEYLSYHDSLTTSNPLYFLIRPVYLFEFGQYKFEAGIGINMVFENTPANSSFTMDVFPLLKAEVVIVEDKIKAYAEVSGNRTINSFRSMTAMNPFITSTPQLINTDEQIKIGGGITGNAGGLNFLAEASYAYINDMPFFVTDTLLALQNKFDVIYDNINLLKVKASLGYVKLDQLSARLFAAYYHYIPKEEEKAWQMPNYEVGLDAGYTFLEKYTVRTSVLALGSKYAKSYEGSQVVADKISGALDLGFGFDYRINRMISAYADVNNLLNQNYQRWYQYPVQGILVMVGVKLSF